MAQAVDLTLGSASWDGDIVWSSVVPTGSLTAEVFYDTLFAWLAG